MPAYHNWIKETAYNDFTEQHMSEILSERLSYHSLRKLDTGEKSYYEDISDVPAAVKASASIGSYKMSYKLLHKLINKHIITGEGTSIYGASNSCICTIIYLCTLCDVTGLVEDFRILDLVGKTCSSERGAYYVLSKLEEKGIIRVECYCKNGYRDIHILDNDFSKYEHTKERYLNLNRSFFNVNDTSEFGFNAFRGLSLFAKKLLLYTLFEYDAQRGRHGYRSYMYRLAGKLGIKTESLVKRYVDEISFMCPLSFMDKLNGRSGPIYTHYSKKEGRRELVFEIRPHGIDVVDSLIDAPTCLKHKISALLKDADVPVVFESENRGMMQAVYSDDIYQKIISEIAGIVSWNSVAFKDSPIKTEDILAQFEKFLLHFTYFSTETIQLFRVYINEFMRLSRQIITPGYVIV